MNRPPVALLAATLLTACAETSPTAPAGTTAHIRTPAAAAADLPFRGSCDVRVDAFIPTDIGPGGVILRAQQLISGTCRLTHLGRTYVELEQDTDYTVLPPVSTSTHVYRAANGDEIHATGLVLNSAPDAFGNVTFAGSLNIVGGTGRFANATGSAAAQGGFNTNTLIGFYSLDGFISP